MDLRPLIAETLYSSNHHICHSKEAVLETGYETKSEEETSQANSQGKTYSILQSNAAVISCPTTESSGEIVVPTLQKPMKRRCMSPSDEDIDDGHHLVQDKDQ